MLLLRAFYIFVVVDANRLPLLVYSVVDLFTASQQRTKKDSEVKQIGGERKRTGIVGCS